MWKFTRIKVIQSNFNHSLRLPLTVKLHQLCDALRDLVPFIQFKNVKNTHGGELLLVKLQASTCNFTERNIHSWVFSTFFKLSKQYQIAKSISYFQLLSSLHLLTLCNSTNRENVRGLQFFWLFQGVQIWNIALD